MAVSWKMAKGTRVTCRGWSPHRVHSAPLMWPFSFMLPYFFSLLGLINVSLGPTCSCHLGFSFRAILSPLLISVASGSHASALLTQLLLVEKRQEQQLCCLTFPNTHSDSGSCFQPSISLLVSLPRFWTWVFLDIIEPQPQNFCFS